MVIVICKLFSIKTDPEESDRHFCRQYFFREARSFFGERVLGERRDRFLGDGGRDRWLGMEFLGRDAIVVWVGCTIFDLGW